MANLRLRTGGITYTFPISNKDLQAFLETFKQTYSAYIIPGMDGNVTIIPKQSVTEIMTLVGDSENTEQKN